MIVVIFYANVDHINNFDRICEKILLYKKRTVDAPRADLKDVLASVICSSKKIDTLN